MKTNCFFLLLISLFVLSCGAPKGPSKEEMEKTKSDIINNDKSSNSMAPSQEFEKKEQKDDFVSGDTTTSMKRQFVRTAEMKYKVKDVRKASGDIELLTAKYDGFITYSNLSSSITGHKFKNISSDSILETTFYTVSSEISLRVPNTSLDSLLNDLNKLINFLDYKIIKADDVSMLMFSNDLNKKRIEKYQKRLTNAIDSKGKKLNDVINAEEKLLNKQQESDYYKTSNMNLYDQVAYSTVKMNIYQRETIQREVIENFDNIKTQKPGFFSRIWNSIKIGWEAVEDIIVGLFIIWWLIILIIVGWYFLNRKLKKDKLKKIAQKQNN